MYNSLMVRPLNSLKLCAFWLQVMKPVVCTEVRWSTITRVWGAQARKYFTWLTIDLYWKFRYMKLIFKLFLVNKNLKDYLLTGALFWGYVPDTTVKSNIFLMGFSLGCTSKLTPLHRIFALHCFGGLPCIAVQYVNRQLIVHGIAPTNPALQNQQTGGMNKVESNGEVWKD